MRKSQLLDLLRLMSAATGEPRLIVVGSQSVHGQIQFLPTTVLRSIEVDIYILPSTPSSKLIAGRDKDLEFISEMLSAEALDFAVFMERAALMRTTVFSGALHSRLTKLAALLRERRWNHLLPPLDQLLASL